MRKRKVYPKVKDRDIIAAIEILTGNEGVTEVTSDLIHHQFFPTHPSTTIRMHLLRLAREGVIKRIAKPMKTGGRLFLYSLPKKKSESEEPTTIPQPVLDSAWATATDKKPEPQKQKLMAECSVCGLMIPLKKRGSPFIVSCGCGADFLQAGSVLFKLEKPEIPINIWTLSSQTWNGRDLDE